MKLTISMMTPGMAFDGDALNKQSLGGSETAALCLARELAALGHQVYHFCNCPNPGEYDKVIYLPLDRYSQFITSIPHDVTIVERMPEAMSGKCSAKLKYLWCHDLAHGRNAAGFNGVLWNIDRVAVVSEWMKKQYMETYGLDDHQVVVMRNGVDFANLAYAGISDRDRTRLIYTARPERGLDVLLSKVFPKVLERVPEATLYIGGYNNQVEHLREFYGYIQQLIQPFGDKVQWLGHMTKPDLYHAYSMAGVYAYPTPSLAINQNFREVSCITAIECMASGLPFVSTNRGALLETCGIDNCLVAGHPSEDEYADHFVDEVVRLMKDDEYYLSKTIAGRKHLDDVGYGWDEIAQDWEREILGRFHEVNSNPNTLVHHLIDTSDIITAQHVLNQYEDNYPALQQIIDKNFGFYNCPNKYREQYEKIGKTHTDIYDGATHESRLATIIAWLKDHDDIKTILDVGCGVGVYAIEISNACPDKKIVAIDVDETTIEWARKYREEKAKYPDNVSFHTDVIDEFRKNHPALGQFDCALAAEVVEHVPAPWSFIQSIESVVKVGGYVMLTVPYGPWEQMSYDTYPHRCHLWNFEYHDIIDMLGGKPKLNVQSQFCGVNDQLAEPLGHNFISYKVNHEPIGQIDLDRKALIQNPKQTVSVNIVCGPGAEETLHWCLKSVLPIAHEIIIGDTGMSDACRDILYAYYGQAINQPSYRLESIKTVTLKSPLDTGFDEARNRLLEESTMDWILWIDTDEKLLEPTKLLKYLQPTGYNGYGIKQHHFAVDTHFDPDMPVRLFRRDAGLHFYGCIAGDSFIETPSGPKAIADLVGQTPWIYAYDTDKDQIVVTKPSEIKLTRKQAPVIEIELDDGTAIRTTHDHPFLMRHKGKENGYKKAMDLRPGDRLMPFYRRSHHERPIIRVSSGKWEAESRFVYSYLNGAVLDSHHVHHLDHDPWNNDPSNLEILKSSEHLSLHHAGKVLSEHTKQLVSQNHAPCSGEDNAMWGRKHSVETRDLIGQKSRERGAGFGNSEKAWFTSEKASEMNKSSWKDPIVRAKRIEGIRKAKAKKKLETQKPDNHRVVAIREAGFEDVYNMEVPGFHNFIANGVVVHNCIHEHPEKALNEGPGKVVVISDVHIAHVGYLIESGRQQRFWRNSPMLKKDIETYPDRLLQKHFIIRDNMLMCSYILRSNGGHMTDQVLDLARETVDLYKRYFLGKAGYVNVDSKQYVSQALKILGEGFDCSYSFTASKDGVTESFIEKDVRYACFNDLVEDINWQLENSVKRFDKEDF